MSGVSQENREGDESEDLPDDESESRSTHHVVCLEHTITDRRQKIEEQNPEKE